CGQCHSTESEAYHRHPMGRSMAPVATLASQRRYDAAARNPFEAGGVQFFVEQLGAHFFYRETPRDFPGRVITRQRKPDDFEIGSGQHGHTYLINRDGYLFQSPSSWYTSKKIWDLAPGIPAEMHSDRQIQAGCIFCHANHAEPVPDSLNRYRQPIFQGFSIG